jgi:hypothetical protein
VRATQARARQLHSTDKSGGRQQQQQLLLLAQTATGRPMKDEDDTAGDCHVNTHGHNTGGARWVYTQHCIPGPAALPLTAPQGRVILSAHRTRTRLPGRFHPQFRDQNRRDIGKSQPKWTASKMDTPGSQSRKNVLSSCAIEMDTVPATY